MIGEGLAQLALAQQKDRETRVAQLACLRHNHELFARTIVTCLHLSNLLRGSIASAFPRESGSLTFLSPIPIFLNHFASIFWGYSPIFFSFIILCFPLHFFHRLHSFYFVYWNSNKLVIRSVVANEFNWMIARNWISQMFTFLITGRK